MKLMISALLIGLSAILIGAPAARAEDKKLLHFERRLGVLGTEYRAGFQAEIDRGLRLGGQVGAGPKQYNWGLHIGRGGLKFDTRPHDAPSSGTVPLPPGAEEV